MKEVFFYNWKREPVMQWSDLNIIGVEEAGLVSFDVKVSKSIFEASIRIKTELSELIDFKENLAKLFEQNILVVVFTSSDEDIKIELRREKSGRIYQRFWIRELSARNNLTVNDYFDQTFLPELIDEINNFIMQ
ncbi:hypothetical protein [Bacteroides acidifaciens]|mgnify:CR=1 FL=1|jgi:hypothetical protein|uniref:Uncharacterized protein n=1 Tax=Bacteroides acidifaciens TaxID=85831 RepID=A0A7J0A916_9BACE|nr:hypothetical protein [Bacteroides acidifaciens]MCR1999675.1 hypothetical protein [Bacteroides acidifaciens]GFH88459.1 hypothetical protein IMSAGC001_03902 [Bacteroides acidifaciens]